MQICGVIRCGWGDSLHGAHPTTRRQREHTVRQLRQRDGESPLGAPADLVGVQLGYKLSALKVAFISSGSLVCVHAEVQRQVRNFLDPATLHTAKQLYAG